MSNEKANELIDLAVAQGFLSTAKAESLKEELFMFPGGNVISIMVRRGFISPEQGKVLEGKPAGTSPDEGPGEIDLNTIDDKPTFEILSGPAATYKPPVAPQPASPPRPPSSSNIKPASGIFQSQQRRTAENIGSSSSASGRYANIGAPKGIAPDPYLLKLLTIGRQRGYSDLHLTVGKPPYMRHEGQLVFLDEPPLTPEKAEQLNVSVLSGAARKEFDTASQVDFSFEVAGAGRFRANVYRQRKGVEGAYRFIPMVVPTMGDLKLPAVLEKLTLYPQGLILVTGPGGSGKTTTVAAMLEHINRHRHEHIVTVEDPVEYVFQPKNCQITQREIGTHTESFGNALRSALRQDPDVIMIGELRDLDTTSIAITAAETGHLVFGTLHTSSAVRTVARILDVYPPAQRAQICLMVAESLRGIISQQLIPRVDGNGRVCAMEVLLVNTGAAQLIKEGKTHQLASHMQSGRRQGMISMDDALMELLQAGLISDFEAYSRAENKQMFTPKSY